MVCPGVWGPGLRRPLSSSEGPSGDSYRPPHLWGHVEQWGSWWMLESYIVRGFPASLGPTAVEPDWEVGRGWSLFVPSCTCTCFPEGKLEAYVVFKRVWELGGCFCDKTSYCVRSETPWVLRPCLWTDTVVKPWVPASANSGRSVAPGDPIVRSLAGA